MSEPITLLDFREAMDLAEDAGKKHVLLGNGFSIGAHTLFKYGTLYEQAKESGLTPHIQAIFERYGTANFEEVLRQLVEGQWLAKHYKLKGTDSKLDMTKDHERIKNALVQAVANTHPPDRSEVSEEKLQTCFR